MVTFMCFTYNIKYYVRPILVFQKCGLTVQCPVPLRLTLILRVVFEIKKIIDII